MATSVQEQPEVDPGSGHVSEEVKRLAEQHRTDIARQKQALHLQRENILSQRTSNPARRTALEAALSQIEAQIQAMG
jgi:multidrug efflux pump subunit AcrA (membrane-fusion protein)